GKGLVLEFSTLSHGPRITDLGHNLIFEGLEVIGPWSQLRSRFSFGD
ncbi:8611_t:CDS:1, partial [Gigaspora rosea]